MVVLSTVAFIKLFIVSLYVVSAFQAVQNPHIKVLVLKGNQLELKIFFSVQRVHVLSHRVGKLAFVEKGENELVYISV